MKKTTTILTIFLICNSLITLQSYSQSIKDSISFPAVNPIIKNSEIRVSTLYDPLTILKSRVPGITFNKQGSNPNQFNSINIRGKSTGYLPEVLYIIDGVFGADPDYLIPETIESIQVIKDGTQLTAYGTQGHSGVVIINTKSYEGQKKISVDFSSFVTLNTPAKKYDLLTADELRSVASRYDMNFFDGGANTDWQKEVIRKTVSQRYNLNISGSLKKIRYDLSLSSLNNLGIVRGSSKKNNVAYLKLNYSAPNNKVKIYANTAYYKVNADILPVSKDNQTKNGIYYLTLTRNPTDPVYESDGVTYHQYERVYRYFNPLQVIEASSSKSSNYNLRLNSGLYYDYKGTKLGLNLAYSLLDKEYKLHQPIETFNFSDQDYTFTNNEKYKRFNLEGMASNSSKVNGHTFFIGGLFRYRNVINYREKNSKTMPIVSQSISSIEDRVNYYNTILKLGYNYKQRYYFNAISTLEVSDLIISDTPKEKLVRINIFPSVNIGWKISSEAFLRDKPFITNLYLQAGYGMRGNGKADYYTFYPELPGTDSLKTERINEFNISLDFGLFRNILTGSISWYNLTTPNGVGNIYLPVPPNFAYFTYGNITKSRSTGIEISIIGKAIDKESLKWNTNFNIFTKKDNLIKGIFADNEGTITGFFDFISNYDYSTQLIKNGYPSRVFYLPSFAGYSSTGEPLYFTETGSTTKLPYQARLDIMSQTDPKIYIGWVNDFTVFKSLNVSVSTSYAGGYSIYNATRMFLSNPSLIPDLNISQEGIDNLEAGYKSSPPLSSLYLEDASNLRIDDITLSYTFKLSKLQKHCALKIYASAGNLLTLTNYSGYDPAGSSDGVDYFDVYPLAKTYTLGLRLNL